MKMIYKCILVLIISILFYQFKFNQKPNFEVFKCPFCYGESMCDKEDINTLRFESVSDIINNLFRVKNVFFTKDNKMVLKKLAHSEELQTVDKFICLEHKKSEDCNLSNIGTTTTEIDYKKLLKLSLLSNEKGYKFCSEDSANKFLTRLETIAKTKEDFISFWVMSLVNIEPLILQLFSNSEFHLPKYYGACGRMIVVQNGGLSLNQFEHSDWFTRAIITRGIINAALKFTSGDRFFRIYLTDISPDNIVVNFTTLQVKFIDLENIILVFKRNNGNNIIHTSYDFASDDFVYSEKEICDSSISDHNVYSICKLLLWDKAPWPMMNGGLLHSIPNHIKQVHPNIFQIIQSCVQSPISNSNRFNLIRELDIILANILSTQNT